MRLEQVFITPKINNIDYGAEIDVSDYIDLGGLSKIKRSIDSTDYSVGVFRFSVMKIKGENGSGIFNENDSRSIFPYVRNLAKVRIVAQEIDQNTGVAVSNVQFKGLINDEATRLNAVNDDISMTVLSSDSVLRTTKIPAGLISNGVTVKTAMEQILTRSEITAVLTISAANINPDINYTIDLGEPFDNQSVNDALDLLLLSSNSSLIIDDSDNVIIGSRDTNIKKQVRLTGRGSQGGESNINSISNYNNGLQRQFNSVLVNDLVRVEDSAHVAQYGLRQKKIDFDFVTDVNTMQDIGQRFIDEFKFPKIELKLIIPTSIVENSALLDPFSVDAPWLKKRAEELTYSAPGGTLLGLAVLGISVLGAPAPPITVIKTTPFFPVLGSSKLGSTTAKLPTILGSVQIDKNIKFKLISREDNPKLFTSTIKLRQSGKLSNDGLSTLGINWTIRESAADNNWISVTYGAGLFVAVSNTGVGNRVMTSPDGINWTIRSSAADNNWRSVIYGAGLFVAVSNTGVGNRVMTSPDGTNWTIRSSAADNDWISVTYGAGLFVAVSYTGVGNRVMTSPDGINWTIRSSAADNAWISVTYGAGLFVAVAYAGIGNEVMTSPDGTNWTIRSSAASNNWASVTYGAGLFVAVSNTGVGNRVMTSPDGINWTIRSSAADNAWNSVIYGDGLFVAVSYTGIGNEVMTSPDGTNWTIRESAADTEWISVTYGNYTFVAVSILGTGNRVMTSN